MKKIIVLFLVFVMMLNSTITNANPAMTTTYEHEGKSYNIEIDTFEITKVNFKEDGLLYTGTLDRKTGEITITTEKSSIPLAIPLAQLLAALLDVAATIVISGFLYYSVNKIVYDHTLDRMVCNSYKNIRLGKSNLTHRYLFSN